VVARDASGELKKNFIDETIPKGLSILKRSRLGRVVELGWVKGRAVEMAVLGDEWMVRAVT